MKASRIFFASVILLIVSLLTWNIFVDERNESEIIVGKIIQLKALDHSYDNFLLYSFNKGIKDMNLPYKLNLNGPYQKEKLNVYIINFKLLDKSEKLADVTTAEFASVIKNNFIALPPNIIFIDKYFLSYLILNAYNEEIAYDQAVDYVLSNQIQSREEVTNFMMTRSAITTYLSIGNYNDYHEGYKNSKVDSLGTNLLPNTFKNKTYYNQFYIYLLPILSHELAHIKFHDQNAKGWVDIQDLVRKQLSDSKPEEKRADSLSNVTIENYMKQSKDNPLRFEQLTHFCRTMRNMVLSDTYRDFRGLSPADLIVTLEQKSNLSNEDLKLPFHYFERVARGYENGPPPMEKDEFNSFLKKLSHSGSAQSHRHMFQRCNAILDIVRSQQGAPIHFLDIYLDLLSVNSSDKKKISKLFLDDSLFSSNISRIQELRFLEDQVVEKKAINYENNHIKIFYFKNGSGYIELHGDENNLGKVVMVLKTRGKNGSIDADGVKNITSFIRFIANQFPNDDEGQLKASEAYSKIRNSEGNLPTVLLSSANNIIKITPVNRSYYVRIEVSDFHNF